jgi:hypothetical protein
MNDKLLTQKEVKEITGLADSTLEQWRLKGKGPPLYQVRPSVSSAMVIFQFGAYCRQANFPPLSPT